MDDRLRDNYPGDALKKGRSEGDARELLDDVSNFFISSYPCYYAHEHVAEIFKEFKPKKNGGIKSSRKVSG